VAEEQTVPAEVGAEDATRVVLISAGGIETQAASPAGSFVALPAIGQEIGPVRLVGELGRGAMGVVFLGHHTLLGRSVAVKVLTATSPALRTLGSTRFADEAKAAATVSDPNLAQIYHADVSGDVPYLVMEYVDGPTLARLLGAVGKLTPAVMIGIMLEVSSAVARLHEHDIIHRDLKPSNVLLDAAGRAVVSDFGLAVSRPPTSSGNSELRLAGTPAYMAPEMFEGRISPRTDIYAMGIMMVQLLNGKVPFEGTIEELREQHLHKPVPTENLAALGVDPALLEVIERATNKQPIFRYKTAQELHRALRALGLDLADARHDLQKLIATLRPGAKPPTALPPGKEPVVPPSSYAETIARVAAATRERKRTSLEAASALELPLPPPSPLSIPRALPAAISLPVEMCQFATLEFQQPLPARPRILTAVAIIGIILAPVAALSCAFDLYMTLIPAQQNVPLPAGWKLLGFTGIFVNLLLMTVLLAASIAAIRRRRWSRRALLAWAFAELISQTAVALAGVLIVVPFVAHRLYAISTYHSPQGADDFGRGFKILLSTPYALRWLLLTALALTLLRVLRLPRVKAALNLP
jgi:serine/threonine protein kinase